MSLGKIWFFEHDDAAGRWKLRCVPVQGLCEKFVYVRTGRLNREAVSFSKEECLERFIKSMGAAMRLKLRLLVHMREGIETATELLRKEKENGRNESE